jgi:hypothetical protein
LSNRNRVYPIQFSQFPKTNEQKGASTPCGPCNTLPSSDDSEHARCRGDWPIPLQARPNCGLICGLFPIRRVPGPTPPAVPDLAWWRLLLFVAAIRISPAAPFRVSPWAAGGREVEMPRLPAEAARDVYATFAAKRSPATVPRTGARKRALSVPELSDESEARFPETTRNATLSSRISLVTRAMRSTWKAPRSALLLATTVPLQNAAFLIRYVA